MTTVTLSQLQAIDPAVLADVVRQDQCSPAFEITSWTAGVLSDKGAATAQGLLLFKGEGRDAQGSRPWSVVLKTLTVDPNPDIGIDSLWHWGREIAVSRSDLLERLPSHVRPPRFYGTTEWDGKVGLWMEHIAGDAPDRCGLDEYAFAARRLGQFNAACLNVQLPAYPWLVRAAIPDWLATWSPEAGWDNPFVQRHLSARSGERILQLWSERERFLSALAAMPQIFSHGDAQRRNLILRANAQGNRDVVAVDWALCRIGPLGADAGYLVGVAALFFDWKQAELQQLDECVFTDYLAGLVDAGWHGDPRMIRLAFTAFFAMWFGVFAPRAIATFTDQEMQSTAMRLFHCQDDALAMGWVALDEYALDRADEARNLMSKLDLA
jgi:hypothetical protein